MSAPTNILFLPVCVITLETETNCDWLDGLEYHDGPPPGGQPIDLTGIAFAMEMRSAPPVATVMLRASTWNGLIRVYANTWQLLVPATTMLLVPPGDYVFDLLGFADGYTRNLVQVQVSILQGITRGVIASGTVPAVNAIAPVDGMPAIGADGSQAR
jgi:hypothetical protein